MEPISMNPVEQNRSKTLLVIGIVVVLIIVALGIYVWRNGWTLSPENTNTPADEINALNVQGTSDNVTSIERDLQATDLDNLDKEASAIDATLGVSPAK